MKKHQQILILFSIVGQLHQNFLIIITILATDQVPLHQKVKAGETSKTSSAQKLLPHAHPILKLKSVLNRHFHCVLNLISLGP